MFIVYILHSEKHDRTYVGFTNNLERRLREHNSGHSKSTKAYKPWIVIYQEEVDTRLKAREREKFLKSGIGRDFIKTIRPRSSTE